MTEIVGYVGFGLLGVGVVIVTIILLRSEARRSGKSEAHLEKEKRADEKQKKISEIEARKYSRAESLRRLDRLRRKYRSGDKS